MSWRVIATSRAFWSSAEEGIRELREAGCELIMPERFEKYPAAELISLLDGCDASLASSETYSAEVFAACPSLKIVARCGVGYDAVDVEAATRFGVVCTNTPGAMVDAVADFTVGLILMCARRMGELDALVHAGGWAELSGTLVSGKTLGLVGYGQIGRAVARRLSGFDMRVLVYDPVEAADSGLSVERVPLRDLLREADFVSVHAPATPETAGMFGAAEFGAMKPEAFFINTSRGALVDEPALIAALEAGAIAGAALDVTVEEPLPADHPLRRAPNLILTAHNAFNAREAASRMCNMAARLVLQLMRGEAPVSTINPEVYDSSALRIPRPDSPAPPTRAKQGERDARQDTPAPWVGGNNGERDARQDSPAPWVGGNNGERDARQDSPAPWVGGGKGEGGTENSPSVTVAGERGQ